jgi:hypothetical protein
MLFDIEPAKSIFNPGILQVQMAMHDAAAFHATLALEASFWAGTQGSKGSALRLESTYHKVQCVQIVRSRLNGRGTPSEGTIIAIICLWGLEVRFINPRKLLSRTKSNNSRSLHLLRLYTPI